MYTIRNVTVFMHKVKHLDECRLMVQWWEDYLDDNKERAVSPFEFAKLAKQTGQ